MTNTSNPKTSNPNEWEPVVRLGTYVPLQMRKRDSSGAWIYRTPTEKEIIEYIADEAW